VNAAKTLAKGLAKSRSKSPSIGLQTLIERAKSSAFVESVKAAVSDDEVLDAAKLLGQQQRNRAKRLGASAGIGATLAPAVSFGSEVAGALARRHGRGRAVATAAKKLVSAPHMAKTVTGGALGGAGFQATRETVQGREAKKTVKTYLEERGHAVS
jgi:hypothetical protein